MPWHVLSCAVSKQTYAQKIWFGAGFTELIVALYCNIRVITFGILDVPYYLNDALVYAMGAGYMFKYEDLFLCVHIMCTNISSAEE